MTPHKITAQSLLSKLWIFVLFNIVFRDLHQFLYPGFIEEMISMNVPETNMLFYGIILEIPIAMVLLSRVLKAKSNKWSNVIAACIVGMGVASNLPTADLDDIFFAVVKLIAVIFIIKTAWKLPFLDKDQDINETEKPGVPTLVP